MRIVTVQRALPSQQVTNDDLVMRILSKTNGRVAESDKRRFEGSLRKFFGRTGAQTRFHRAPGERAVDFGVAAGRLALEKSGINPTQIDLLIYVGVGRGFLEPATANVFQDLLGLTNATCFDILDACASWLRAVDVARHLLRGGTLKRVMILNCEFNFEEYIRWDLASKDDLGHLGAGFTVGEAATATILEATEEDGFYTVFRTRGRHFGLCQIPLPNAEQYLPAGYSNGHPPMHFFAYAVDLNTAAVAELADLYWSDPRLSGGGWDLVLGHSTSTPAAREVVEKLKLDASRLLDTFPRFGNTVSASLPLGMSLAIEAGRLERGDSVLMVVASAGLTAGFCRFEF